MAIFKKAKKTPDLYAVQSERSSYSAKQFDESFSDSENLLYEQLRVKVPIIDASINKIVRLCGSFKVKSSSKRYQNEIDDFINTVKVGVSGKSLYSFMDCYLDSLLTYGNAIGEIIINPKTGQIDGLYNADSTIIKLKQGANPLERKFLIKDDNKFSEITYPDRLLYSTLNPNPKCPQGVSILRGLPCISSILLRIYECIGQNFERVGNVRYAVTYKPSSDSGEKAFAKERALQIAKEWADGMNSSKDGQLKDFVAVGDVDIKVIGSDSPLIDSEVPVRQLLEQIVAKLSIPPFLLGLSWSTTERMSKQQTDMLTSELEFYRRLLNPVILQIVDTFTKLSGIDTRVSVEWDNINLQDECDLAQARLDNAKASQIEQTINQEGEQNGN